MHPEFKLVLVGLSHRTAPVDVREQYVVSQEDQAACVQNLMEAPEIKEAAVVSTCNRTEILVCGGKDADVVECVLQRVFRNLPREHTYVYEDVHAVIHVFRVAAGLDSVVLGESEVLGQVKRAHELGTRERTLGTLLEPLLQQAVRVGKRVRSETSLGRGSLSVAKVAVDIAGRVVGSFEKRRALVVGSGETGVLVSQHLKSRGIGSLTLANRTVAHAEEAARELGAEAHGLGAINELLKASDLVFTCVDGGAFELGVDSFDPKRLARRDSPLFVADLSLPRVVHPDVRALNQILLYDLDDLGRIVETNRRQRSEAADGSSNILVAEIHKYLSLRTYASFTPAIARLRERFEQTRDEVIDRVAGTTASPEVLQLSHVLSKRLLDVALSQMKDSARQTQSEELLDREYHRFLENL